MVWLVVTQHETGFENKQHFTFIQDTLTNETKQKKKTMERELKNENGKKRPECTEL